jgi:hypothetical protein
MQILSEKRQPATQNRPILSSIAALPRRLRANTHKVYAGYKSADYCLHGQTGEAQAHRIMSKRKIMLPDQHDPAARADPRKALFFPRWIKGEKPGDRKRK